MVTITTRQSQLEPLSHAQVDANFQNLKGAVEVSQAALATYAQQSGAASIGVTPAGGIQATNVQAALVELDNEKAPKDHPTFVASSGEIASFNSLATDGGYTTFKNNGVTLGYIGAGSPLVSGTSKTDMAIRSETGATVFGTGAIERARIDGAGNLLVGLTSGTAHRIAKAVNEGITVLNLEANPGVAAAFYSVGAFGWNAAATAALFGKNSTTNRSINAGGTVNASGADYAEYMTKAADCGEIPKGAIVGVNAQGLLTDKWFDAVGFLIKSTDPSYVGGDTWGNIPRPVEPVFEAPADDVQAAQDEFDTVTMPAYLAELEAFLTTLEAARQRVDRIAFCGQVPVNVLGAQPGQYVLPAPDGDGIKGVLVTKVEMNFGMYRDAIGVVQNILPDGRANVRVKI